MNGYKSSKKLLPQDIRMSNQCGIHATAGYCMTGLLAVPCEIPPALIPANFDEPRPQHDSHDEPPVSRDRRPRSRRPRRKLFPVRERYDPDGEEARLQQLALPAEGVPLLPDVDDGVVEQPQEQHRRAAPRTRDEHRHGQGHAGLQVTELPNFML